VAAPVSSTSLRSAERELLAAIQPALHRPNALAPAFSIATGELRAAGYRPVEEFEPYARLEADGGLAWLGSVEGRLLEGRLADLRCTVIAVRMSAEDAVELTTAARDVDFPHFAWLSRRDGLDFLEWDAIEPAGTSAGTLLLVHRDAPGTVAGVIARLRREWQCGFANRLTAIYQKLPTLGVAHERALRAELGIVGTEDADALDRLSTRLDVLAAERDNLLVDRRSSLRAWAWRPVGRVRHWSQPRLGVPVQHAPRPLKVPRRYLHTRAPRDAPAISIVTPSLDQGEFLERTLLSVSTQRYPNLEHVVQDGGSTDGSVAILERHERALSRWSSGADGGQASAINHGFRHTSGAIMAYLNADDVLLPGSLAFVARYFAAHPEVDAVYGHRIFIDEADRQVGIWITPPHDDEMLRWSDCVPQETLFWRRELWDRVGGIDERFGFALDWDLLLRFRSGGARVVRLNRLLGGFRVHPTQKTTRMFSLGEEECGRLRAREHGRPVSRAEAFARVKPYLRRHIAWHTAYRFAARLPAPRVSPPYLEAADRSSVS
jgi:GT2 family glycosyltransferase